MICDKKQKKTMAAKKRYERKLDGHYQAGRDWKKGAVSLSTLVPELVDDIFTRKGLTSSALIAAWPDLAGSFAKNSIIETIRWHGHSDRNGTLVIRVDGPEALYLQHEESQIIERVNKFLGCHAISRLKIIQTPITKPKIREKQKLPELSQKQEVQLHNFIGTCDNEALNQAILKMGREVFKRALFNKKNKT